MVDTNRVSNNLGADGPDAMVDVRNVRKVYDGPDGELTAVDGVSFSIDQGTIVGVLGPNGAGKTTLIKSMLGLIIPTEGSVRIRGLDVHNNPSAVYEHAGAMLEGARNIYWRLTVRENLEFFGSLAGRPVGADRERHDELAKLFGISDKMDEPANELSRGMKQKVSLASTMARGCSVLFLDEPTLGLDVESSIELRRELRRLVDRDSLTVILSSHDMDVIEELCDRVIILNDGQVIADETVESLTAVFDSQQYEVRINGPVPEPIRDRIKRNYVVDRWDTDSDSVRFNVVLDDAYGLYDLFDTLEESGRPIASINAVEPDLETIFLEMTNNADGRVSDRDGDRVVPEMSDGVDNEGL